MILSLCVITKGDGELPSLKRAVLSVIDYVDHVYITTNAKDYKKTEKWCDSIGKIEHSHLAWKDDFSQQRNFNFSQVSSDTDYIVWMDSDDVIVNAHLLKDIARISKANGYDTVFFAYWYGAKFDGEPSVETFVEAEIVHYRERLIRPGSIVWKKRIHESPVPLDSDNYRYSRVTYSRDNPVVWLHLGADRDIPKELLDKRMDRNQRLLEMELSDERSGGEADPRTILYLMEIYAESEDTDVLRECINMGNEYISKSGWDQERAVCYQLMGRCYGSLGEHAKAKDIVLKAIGEYPHDPVLYLHLARCFYNLGNFKSMKHWLDTALKMDVSENNTAMNNILEMKVLSAELLLQYNLFGENDVRKAYGAAKMLNKINPTPTNQQNEDHLFNQAELDKASGNAHSVMKYMESIMREDLIPGLVKALPEEMQELPFANKYLNRFSVPKVWGNKEICYYANFGGSHFEKWDGNSTKSGIGGSETAVIRLSEEWTRMGYSVVVYGDPKKEIEINGVLYKPWYTFNQRDKFNIFIQWRSSAIVDRISSKKILVDLHDVFHESSHLHKLDQIDKLMVKSKFHRNYASNIVDEKVEVISNGIN